MNVARACLTIVVFRAECMSPAARILPIRSDAVPSEAGERRKEGEREREGEKEGRREREREREGEKAFTSQNAKPGEGVKKKKSCLFFVTMIDC